ncbi:hypothetical protein M0804_006136 [Polistes exclamans]|nr:hypothetical protein M0804_006136 [Polistes exclamans]
MIGLKVNITGIARSTMIDEDINIIINCHAIGADVITIGKRTSNNTTLHCTTWCNLNEINPKGYDYDVDDDDDDDDDENEATMSGDLVIQEI